MRWTLLLACSLLLAPLTGCATSEDDEDEFRVAWDQQPDDGTVGEAISMSWVVNGPEGEIPHTGVHYASSPVEDPQSPADYGNTVDAVEPAQIPGQFDAETAFDEEGTYFLRAHAIVGEDEHRWSEEVQIRVTEDEGGEDGYEVTWVEEPGDGENQTTSMSWQVDGPEGEIPHTGVHYASSPVEDPQSPADYGNTSGAQEPAEGPGTFETEITFEEPGTYHVRAHAIVGEDEHRWSEEIAVEIGDAAGQHNVTIVSIAQGYDPAELTVAPGDEITWENADAVTHTVTFDDETLGDSGDIAAGETYTLTVPEDIEPGTYDYACTYHASMEANITVEASEG